MTDDVAPNYEASLQRMAEAFRSTLSGTAEERQKVMADAFQPDPEFERLLALRDSDPDAWARLIEGTHTPEPTLRVAVSYYARSRQAWLAEHPGETLSIGESPEDAG
ncbi:MAG TPA: hypothetical protein VFS96_04420 [Nitrolancea sp.]|nr:hypothetical protein [Nitrolancea sp.]